MDYIKEKLHKKHLKVTPARVHLISLLEDSNSAVSFSDIQDKLVQYDRVTIYRSLNTLEDKGLIHKVQSDNNESYFALCEDSCTTHDHHHDHIHFSCKTCNKITCVPIKNEIKLDLKGYEVEEIKILVEGKCNKCS